MKIGIMAPQESGKTSYLVGLYGTLVHISKHGLNYEWLNKVQQKLLEHQYENLLEESLIGKARFPPKTDEIIHHRVRVGHKKDSVYGEIELIDFPGEVLKGEEEKGKVKPVDLERALTECAGFIVLLDANYLKLAEYKGSLKGAVGHIDAVLRKTIEKRTHSSIGVPVSLCISKYDVLSPQEKELAHGKVKTMFERFFDLNDKHPIFITGVSLGDKIENGGEFEPFQLESAIEFCLAFCAFQERDSQHQQASTENDRYYEARRQARGYEEKIQKRDNMNPLEVFGDWWTTGKTRADYQKEADEHNDTAQYHDRREESYRSRASEFIKIGEEAARCIRDVDNPGKIYYKNQVYRFKQTIGTDFPLEEFENIAALGYPL